MNFFQFDFIRKTNYKKFQSNYKLLLNFIAIISILLVTGLFLWYSFNYVTCITFLSAEYKEGCLANPITETVKNLDSSFGSISFKFDFDPLLRTDCTNYVANKIDGAYISETDTWLTFEPEPLSQFNVLRFNSFGIIKPLKISGYALYRSYNATVIPFKTQSRVYVIENLRRYYLAAAVCSGYNSDWGTPYVCEDCRHSSWWSIIGSCVGFVSGFWAVVNYIFFHLFHKKELGTEELLNNDFAKKDINITE